MTILPPGWASFFGGRGGGGFAASAANLAALASRNARCCARKAASTEISLGIQSESTIAGTKQQVVAFRRRRFFCGRLSPRCVCVFSRATPHPHPHTRGREHEYEKTSAAMASRISIKLKHAGVTHELELDPSCECPYNRAAALLSLPKDRIKILRLGKLLPPPGSPSLRDALVAGGMYMVTGTSADAQLPSSTRRHFASAVEALSAVYASLTWVFVRSWLIWLLSMLSAAPRVGFRFVSSMVVPPARPDGGQRPPRAHAE